MPVDGPCAGQVVVVTGASRGIGAALAARFALAGACVVCAARTLDPDSKYLGSLRETVDRISDAGGDAIAIRTDLSDATSRAHLVEETTERFGKVDVLVNNAAVIWMIPATEMPEKRYRVMFEVELHAPFHLSQLVIPQMRERHEGWILNISSNASRHPGTPLLDLHRTGVITVYGMTKAALERMTTGLAAELRDDGIVVNALSPSRLVATEGARLHFADRVAAGELESPSVMAEAALALCTRTTNELSGRLTTSQELVDELGLTPMPLL